MEMGFEEFQLGIPFNESKLEQLVPVYRKSSEVLTQRRKRTSCKTWCKRSAECFGYKRVSDGASARGIGRSKGSFTPRLQDLRRNRVS